MISALLDDRRPLYVEGRRFLMRKVALADVVRLYAVLGVRGPLSFEAGGDLGQKILESISTMELAEMICWLLEPADPVWVGQHLTPEKLREIVAQIESMNDFPLIFKRLNLDGIRPEKAAGQPGVPRGPGRSGLEIAVDVIARRYGRPPHEVLGWPVEEVFALLDAFDEEIEAASPPKPSRVHANDVPDSIIAMAGAETGKKVH